MNKNVKTRNSGWLKYLAAMNFFMEKENQDLLINHIFKIEETAVFEFDLR